MKFLKSIHSKKFMQTKKKFNLLPRRHRIITVNHKWLKYISWRRPSNVNLIVRTRPSCYTKALSEKRYRRRNIQDTIIRVDVYCVLQSLLYWFWGRKKNDKTLETITWICAWWGIISVIMELKLFVICCLVYISVNYIDVQYTRYACLPINTYRYNYQHSSVSPTNLWFKHNTDI